MIIYLLLFATIIPSVAMTFFGKKSTAIMGGGFYVSVLFTAMVALAEVVIFLILNGFRLSLAPLSFLCAVIYGLAGGFSTIFSRKAYTLGKLSTQLIITQSITLTLPFLFGILFLFESAGPYKWLGLGVLIAATIYKNLNQINRLNKVSTATSDCATEKPATTILDAATSLGNDYTTTKESTEPDTKTTILFIILCVAQGLTGTISAITFKWMSVYAPASDNYSFIIVVQMVIFVVFLFILLVKHRAVNQNIQNNPKIFGRVNILLIVAYAFFGGVAMPLSQYVQGILPISIVTPITMGVSFILNMVMAQIAFGEKITRTDFISCCGYIVSMVLIVQ